MCSCEAVQIHGGGLRKFPVLSENVFADKQISTVDLGAFENEQNRLRLRRNAAGKEPPSPTVKLNKENDELTKLMASSTDERN